MGKKKVVSDFEMKERTVGFKTKIDDARKYIKEVYIFNINNIKKENPFIIDFFKDAVKLLIKKKIPYFIYTNEKYFILQNKRKTKKINDIKILKSEIKKSFSYF